jgi:adenylyl- and sulfurtransferase ThiI
MDKDEVARIAREAATAATAEAEKKFTAELKPSAKPREAAEKKHAADLEGRA